MQAAHRAARTKGTGLAAKYRRMATRRGARRAIMAVAHRLLLIAYHVILRREPYRDLGADYLEHHQPSRTVDRLVQQLRDLGVAVTVTAEATDPASRADLILAATP